jgi:Tol biopolymer transport system component
VEQVVAMTAARVRGVAVVTVLVAVIVLTGVGVVRVLGAADRERGRAMPSASNSAAPSSVVESPAIPSSVGATSPALAPIAEAAPPPAMSDVAFVDVRTGAVTPLPGSIRELPGAQEFRVSPEGSMLAFENDNEIYVATVDGSEVRRLTDGPAMSRSPTWSPDGRSLVFVRSRYEADVWQEDLYRVQVDSGSVRRLTDLRGRIWAPNVSPDGSTLLFTNIVGQREQLWTAEASGRSPQLLMPGAFGVYSPDGSHIAYRRIRYNGDIKMVRSDGAVWLASADGRRLGLLGAQFLPRPAMRPGLFWATAWSPDGAEVAFQPASDEPIWVRDVDTGILVTKVWGTDPSWFDGHTLIVEDAAITDPVSEEGDVSAVSPAPPVPAVDPADIDRIDLRAGETTPLPMSIRGISERVAHVRVSPDGSTLAFDDGVEIYVANVDGTLVRQLTREGGVSEVTPSWSPDGSTIVFKRGTGTRTIKGSGIYVADVATRRISRVISTYHEVWYPNFSGDGRTILFTKPYGGRLTLWTVPVTGGASTLLRGGAFGAYSPDGTLMAFRRSNSDGTDLIAMTDAGVYVARADGTHARPVLSGSAWMSQVDADALWPAWSPDGTRLAFQTLYGKRVTVVDVRTRRVTSTVQAGDPSWLDDDTLVMRWFA